jgi:hypothetical protein
MKIHNRFLISAATAALLAGPAMADTKGGSEMKSSNGNQTASPQQASAETGSSGSERQQASSGGNASSNAQDDKQQGFSAGDSSSNEMSQEERDAMVASQEAVRETLTEAGFSDIRVQSASYLVAAMSPQGEPVMMLIDTDRQIRDAYRAQDEQASNTQN